MKNTFILYITLKKITKKNKTLWYLAPISNVSRHTLSCFDWFKSDIGTRRQFECCGIWLECRKFSIDAQLMYCYSTSDVHCHLWLRQKMHWKMSAVQVRHFMHRNLQMQRRKILYLSLPIYSVELCKDM